MRLELECLLDLARRVFRLLHLFAHLGRSGSRRCTSLWSFLIEYSVLLIFLSKLDNLIALNPILAYCFVVACG